MQRIVLGNLQFPYAGVFLSFRLFQQAAGKERG